MQFQDFFQNRIENVHNSNNVYSASIEKLFEALQNLSSIRIIFGGGKENEMYKTQCKFTRLFHLLAAPMTDLDHKSNFNKSEESICYPL